MEIRNLDSDNIWIKGNGVEVILSLNGKYPHEYEKADNTVIIDLSGPKENTLQHLITRPGEYEVNEALILAFDAQNDGKLSLIGIDVEGIRLVYIANTINGIDKKFVEQLGVSHIILIDIEGRQDVKLSDMIYEIEPFFAVPLRGSKVQNDAFAKDLGYEQVEAEKVLKFKQEQFKEEEVDVAVQLLG